MVSIDNVYRTVLNILNKENRGYVTPAEFNTLAKQAQTEIFEMYFTTQYRVSQGPMSDGDYSDISRNIEEKITFFDNVQRVSKILGTRTINTIAATSTGNTTVIDLVAGQEAIDIRPVDTVVRVETTDFPVVSVSGDSITIEGDVTSIPTTVQIRTSLLRYPMNFYRLGTVIANNVVVDEVEHKRLPYINLSPLTAPVATQPVYTRHEGGVTIYPTTLEEANMVYVRQPATPMWVGATAMGQLIVNDTDTVDFELHASEEPELVAKILAYSGVIVRAADVTQAASAKEQQIGQDNG